MRNYLIPICITLFGVFSFNGCGPDSSKNTSQALQPYIHPLDTAVVSEFEFRKDERKDSRLRLTVGDVAFIYGDPKPVSYQKRAYRENPIRTLNEVGSRAAQVFGQLLERDDFTLPCIPFDEEVNNLIRLRPANRDAGAYRILAGRSTILNPEDILEQLEKGEWISVNARITIDKVEEYDILTSIQTGSHHFLPAVPIRKTIEFSFQWNNNYQQGEMYTDKSTLQELANDTMRLVSNDLDLFPCLLMFYENPTILQDLESPESDYPQKSRRSGDIYGKDLLEEIRKLRKMKRLD